MDTGQYGLILVSGMEAGVVTQMHVSITSGVAGCLQALHFSSPPSVKNQILTSMCH